MASNTFASNADTPNGQIIFGAPVDHLNINIDSGTFAFSTDGDNYVNLPTGFHSFRVGIILKLYINASGNWQLIGVQA